MDEMKQYLKEVRRGLRLDRKTRARVMSDLAGDLESRRQAGQTPDQIRAELGTPDQAAAALNDAFPDHRSDASRWRWLFVGLAGVWILLVLDLPGRLTRLFFTDSATIGIIGGADGPTAIYVTSKWPGLVSDGVPFLCACLAGFLLLGWCRRGGKGRLWLPILLCIFSLVTAVFFGGLLPLGFTAAALGFDGWAIAGMAVSRLLCCGVWLSLPLLIAAIRLYRRR